MVIDEDRGPFDFLLLMACEVDFADSLDGKTGEVSLRVEVQI